MGYVSLSADRRRQAADVTVPLRGCTPHFRIDSTVREMQIVTARMTTDAPTFSFHVCGALEVVAVWRAVC